MKESIIIIIILVLIISGDLVLGNYLEKSSHGIVKGLEELEENIKENKENKELINKANKIYDNWKKIEEKWAMLVLHSELDQIETSLIKTKTQIEENRLRESLEEIDISLFLIKHISNKEKFCLKNVF